MSNLTNFANITPHFRKLDTSPHVMYFRDRPIRKAKRRHLLRQMLSDEAMWRLSQLTLLGQSWVCRPSRSMNQCSVIVFSSVQGRPIKEDGALFTSPFVSVG